MRARLFVWTAWAVVLAADLWLVAAYGSRVPRLDDWFLVPALTGERPVTGPYLWQLHNEHRVPLLRMVLLGLHRATGNDFRAGMFLNVLLLGALAAALIAAAGRLRGGVVVADVFFPLALLSWGHCQNLLWSWQVQFVLSAALGLAFLVAVAVGATPLTPVAAAAAGLCVALLPGCGANGLLLVPPLVLWLVVAGLTRWRSGTPAGRTAGAVALALATLTLVEGALYALAYHSPRMWPRPGPARVFATALEFLATAWGIVYPRWWPLYAAATVATIAAGVFAGLIAWRNDPGQRLRVLALWAMALSVVCLALGVAWGRAGFPGPMGLTWRYVTLSVPVLCATYLMLALPHTGTWARWGQALLALGMAATLYHNTDAGLRFARAVHEESEGFARDLRLLPPEALVDAYRRTGIAPDPLDDPSEWVEWLRMLRRARLGPFRQMADEPPSATVTVPLTDGRADNVLHLPRPRHVYAVRVRYRYPHSDDRAVLLLSWREAEGRPWSLFQRELPREGKEDSVLVWIDGTVSDLGILPDGQHPADPNTRLLGVALLVPVKESS